MSSIALLLAASLMAAPPLPQAVQEKERGDRLAANGDTAGAREAYQSAVRLSPGYAAPLNELGILLVNDTKLADAVEFFQKAIAADPSFALAQNNLGFTLRKLSRFAEAAVAYKAYVALEPKDAAGFFGLGEALKGAGDKANALNAYEKCLAVATDQNNQKFMTKAENAAAPLRKELANQPTTAQPTTAQPTTAQPTTAQPTTAQPTTAQPTATPADKVALAKQKVDEGIKARQAGKLRDALFAMQDAATVDPNNVQAIFELGVSYAMLNYYPQAIERWQRVLVMATDDSTRTAAQQNIDKAKLKMGVTTAQPTTAQPTTAQPTTAQPTTAQPTTAQPTTAQPTTAQPTPEQPKPMPLTPEAQNAYNTGVQLYGQQKYSDALHQFDRAIAAKPDFAQAFAARGSAYFALRDFARALNDYGQAMRLDRTMASPLFGVAESYNAMGRKADAAPYYQAYIMSKAPDAAANLQEIAKQRMADIK